MGSLGGEDAGQGCGWSTRQALAVPHLHADKLGGTMWSKTDHITQVPAQKKKASKPLAIKTCEGFHSRRNSQPHRRVPWRDPQHPRCTQTYPPGNQHQKVPICLWVAEKVD